MVRVDRIAAKGGGAFRNNPAGEIVGVAVAWCNTGMLDGLDGTWAAHLEGWSDRTGGQGSNGEVREQGPGVCVCAIVLVTGEGGVVHDRARQ